jgi:hypothetical protein
MCQGHGEDDHCKSEQRQNHQNASHPRQRAAPLDGRGALEVVGGTAFARVWVNSVSTPWRSRNQARWQKAKSLSSEARV